MPPGSVVTFYPIRRIAAPREVVEMDVMNSPKESVVEPQSVPSRISVVLVEEATVGGAQRVERPLVDQDLRLLAGVAKPASVTVCEGSHESPCVEETLSSPDLAGKLFPVVPAGIPLPVGHVGLYGMKSPSDLTPISPVGPYTGPADPFGTLSRSTLTLSARMLHVARCARMGRCPCVTLSSL